jgi:hypothetical protein
MLHGRYLTHICPLTLGCFHWGVMMHYLEEAQSFPVGLLILGAVTLVA